MMEQEQKTDRSADPSPDKAAEDSPVKKTAESSDVSSGDDLNHLWDSLRNVDDPDLHINIVDLGLVYEVSMTDKVVDVKMTLTSPGCPYGPYLLHEVDPKIRSHSDVEDVKIDVVWEPPWTPDRMTEDAKLELGFDL